MLKHLSDLPVVKAFFNNSSSASGLNLKLSKCGMILLSMCANESNSRLIGEWLSYKCPGREHMDVTTKAKYLGIFLGPFAGSCQWPKAIERFQVRVATISSLHLPPALTRIQGASRALPVLAYILTRSFLPPQE